jgi:hypothetical protein
MPFIPFPNVPDVPGVPPLARSATVFTPIRLGLDAAKSALFELSGVKPPVWGVFLPGGRTKALDPDSFLAVDYRNDSRVSTYPLEQGAFASYNKVQSPYEVRVRMAIGADQDTRSQFLAKCDAMLHSTDRFDVVTPEAVYLNATVTNFDYRREASSGATLIVVEMWFEEVREIGVAQYSSVKSPGAADPVSNGQVQAFPVRSGQIEVRDLQ